MHTCSACYLTLVSDFPLACRLLQQVVSRHPRGIAASLTTSSFAVRTDILQMLSPIRAKVYCIAQLAFYKSVNPGHPVPVYISVVHVQ